MLHPWWLLVAPVKSFPEITMTYFVNLAQKHSLHKVIREIDTDSIYPAVHMPAHILLLLILKKYDIIYMIMSLYLLIKSNWSYICVLTFRSTSLLLGYIDAAYTIILLIIHIYIMSFSQVF